MRHHLFLAFSSIDLFTFQVGNVTDITILMWGNREGLFLNEYQLNNFDLVNISRLKNMMISFVTVSKVYIPNQSKYPFWYDRTGLGIIFPKNEFTDEFPKGSFTKDIAHHSFAKEFPLTFNVL